MSRPKPGSKNQPPGRMTFATTPIAFPGDRTQFSQAGRPKEVNRMPGAPYLKSEESRFMTKALRFPTCESPRDKEPGKMETISRKAPRSS